MVANGVGPASETNGSGHLSENELAGFLDRDLAPAERLRIEAHLDACAICRGELVEMRRITASFQRGARSSARVLRFASRWWVPAAVAAGLAAVILPRLRVTAPDSDTQPVRAVDGEGQPRIDIVSPAENATIAEGAIVLTWHATAADMYRVSLLAESGEPVWTGETADTALALPDSVQLQRGRPYFWRVDAIANGITATTGVHRLLLGP